MRKIIGGFGLLSGLLNLAYLINMGLNKSSHNFANGFIYGYATMIISLSLVFVGVYKAKQHHVSDTFKYGKAFLTGLGISFISACLYAFGWFIVNHWLYPSFMDDYVNYEISLMKTSGKSAEDLELFAQQMMAYSEMYQNPFLAFLISLSEILPLGFLFSVLAAAFFRKN